MGMFDKNLFKWQNKKKYPIVITGQRCLLVINPLAKLGFCRNPKVSSSTWLTRFKSLIDKKVINWANLSIEAIGAMHEDAPRYVMHINILKVCDMINHSQMGWVERGPESGCHTRRWNPFLRFRETPLWKTGVSLLWQDSGAGIQAPAIHDICQRCCSPMWVQCYIFRTIYDIALQICEIPALYIPVFRWTKQLDKGWPFTTCQTHSRGLHSVCHQKEQTD